MYSDSLFCPWAGLMEAFLLPVAPSSSSEVDPVEPDEPRSEEDVEFLAKLILPDFHLKYQFFLKFSFPEIGESEEFSLQLRWRKKGERIP